MAVLEKVPKTVFATEDTEITEGKLVVSLAFLCVLCDLCG